MRTVLVTGKIGSGKSEVCKHLSDRGWPVYDCDSRCKILYEKVPGLKKRIEDELGIPFTQLGRIFRDDGLRGKLEGIVFPLLLQDIKGWRESLGEAETAFIESATALSHREFDGVYDEVLMIEAPLPLREGRNPKASERDALQNYDCSKATHTIENIGTIEELHKITDELYGKN